MAWQKGKKIFPLAGKKVEFTSIVYTFSGVPGLLASLYTECQYVQDVTYLNTIFHIHS
jgi:hypothetical protein